MLNLKNKAIDRVVMIIRLNVVFIKTPEGTTTYDSMDRFFVTPTEYYRVGIDMYGNRFFLNYKRNSPIRPIQRNVV